MEKIQPAKFKQPVIELPGMRQITSEAFAKTLEWDPAWAAKLTEPVQITDYCHLTNSKITHLSPFLHFTGQNVLGNAAMFEGCHKLKIVEGTFHSRVSFPNCLNLEKIGQLNITKPNQYGAAADFYKCKQLKIAEGTFPGFVSFVESGIETVGDLNIILPNEINLYIRIQNTPIEQNPSELKKLIRKIFVGKSITELKKVQSVLDEQEIPLKRAIGEKIQVHETALNKNAAVEIQID